MLFEEKRHQDGQWADDWHCEFQSRTWRMLDMLDMLDCRIVHVFSLRAVSVPYGSMQRGCGRYNAKLLQGQCNSNVWGKSVDACKLIWDTAVIWSIFICHICVNIRGNFKVQGKFLEILIGILIVFGDVSCWSDGLGIGLMDSARLETELVLPQRSRRRCRCHELSRGKVMCIVYIVYMCIFKIYTNQIHE